MKLDHKSFAFEVKLDQEKRRISGYGAVFGNVDSSGDIIVPGAFIESLSRRMPAMLYQHWSEKLIGVYDVAREDSKGLYVEGPLAKTPLADEAYELASMGALKGMSIGYNAMDYEYDNKNIRTLKKVELWEVSLVTFPANEMAQITGVKEKPTTIREFEDFLRDEGYSREEAKTIASRGFKALPSNLRDADPEEAKQLVSSIDHAINILKG